MGHNGTFSLRYSDMMTMALMLITLTIICSFFTTILIELPLVALEELLMPKKSQLKESRLTNEEAANKQQVATGSKNFSNLEPAGSSTNGAPPLKEKLC